MKPTKTFRIIRGAAANHKVIFYSDKETRDTRGQYFANLDKDTVLLEEWTQEVEDRCAPINHGWSCDGVAKPQDDTLHKATPVKPNSTAEQSCVHCDVLVKRVLGGQGAIWIHTDGHVVARDAVTS